LFLAESSDNLDLDFSHRQTHHVTIRSWAMSRFPMIIFTLPAIVAQAQELVETPSAKLDAAIKSGQIAWKFSEPEEIVELLGKPEKEEIIHDGNEF
jgi:hypothetical protein